MELFLDGRRVQSINAFLEDGAALAAPDVLVANSNRIYQGSIFLGDGFVLSKYEAAELIFADVINQEVISRLVNGQEINSDPEQQPSRSIINFRDWPRSSASKYSAPFLRLESIVKPERERSGSPDNWWQFWRPRVELYRSIDGLDHCFVAARTTKHLNFSAVPTDYVFTDALYVFTTHRWDLYAVVQSTLHEVWARKYSGALETRLRYSPSDCFETFAFPEGLWRPRMLTSRHSASSTTSIGSRSCCHYGWD